ncbi:MAG: endolytic transglycosylase MltG [Rhodospirillales bacterium]
MIGFLRAVFLLLCVAAILAGGAFFWVQGEFNKPGPLSADKNLVIPRGTGVEGIANLLHREGVITNPAVFRIGVRLEDAQRGLRAGEFMFPAGASAHNVMSVLLNAQPVRRRITIPEGLTTQQVLEIVDITDGLAGQTPGSLDEGILLPETYYFTFGDEREALIQRMRSASEAALAELWPDRVEGLPIRTPQEALILASIVEKETAVAQERQLVASVFINRLNRGMRLQSDPTVVYAVTGGSGPLGRSISKADLGIDSPYNTYRNAGLPPGPIANPGRASIAAVLNPAESNYLYFVADGTGGHAFATNLSDHNRNVARWRRLRSLRSQQQDTN